MTPIARAEKFLDDALLADERRLRIVHGHGTGRLRDALRDVLPRSIRSSRASPPRADNEGGDGATIVEAARTRSSMAAVSPSPSSTT